ncbi:alcohol acyltransferase 9 [Mercurialis annua]|uniref:alcohol acyltransferase 9 n=1 Tax=Mercurialis annua TaxID=3986 RepID=UPI002160A504|nr:alcohol acyltransferase 9 [Mercurialis annua]
MAIHVKEVTVIKPSNSTPTRFLTLSALDSQLFLRFTIEYLFVYKPSPGLDHGSITARVKSALANILVPYYPLAGRVRAKPDGSSLEVICRAQGALFIEAISDNITINDFDKAPSYVEQWKKLLSFHVADVLQGAPLLVVQLTWLNDGGATLGVCFNHCVCDGIGSAEFLNSFASLAMSQDQERVITGLKPKPVWDRHLLDPVSYPSFSSQSHPEFNRVPDLCGFLTRFTNEKLSPTTIIIDKRRQNELKKLAMSSTHHESTFTSFEVISAHVWRSWAGALNLPSNQILKLLFSINVRNRVKPSLPDGYYGNAFVLGCAQTTVKELTEKGLGHAALLIKKAKERVDNEYIRSVIESVSRTSPDSVGVLIISQWSRLGLERVDFGIGRPIHVGPTCCDRYCLILPVFDRTADVKVMVAVPASGVDKYENLVNSSYS